MAIRFITAEQLIAHCTADGDDQANIEQYGEGAELQAEKYLNRTLFADQAALDEARNGVQSALATAKAAYDAAVEAADGDADQEAIADAIYRESRCKAFADLHGMVINQDIVGAILMIAAHRWTNRSDVVAGNAVEVPLNSRNILRMWRYLEGTF